MSDRAVSAQGARILVLGANGRLGRHVTSRALDLGASVTAFVRTRDGLPSHSRLTVVDGQVSQDRNALTAALRGHDAVASALGNPLWLKGLRGPAIMGASVQNLVSAMHEASVRRVVVPLAWGTGKSRDAAGRLVALIAATLIRRDYRDFDLAERRLVQSDLDWTIAYFGALTDAPPSQRWTATSRMERPTSLSISRADVACFLVSAALSDQCLGKRIVLSGPKGR